MNESGDLVAESDPAATESELANRVYKINFPFRCLKIINLICFIQPLQDSDNSDSSESASETEAQNSDFCSTPVGNSIETLLGHSNMTSYESMAAQLAAVASLHGLQTPSFSGLSQFQPGII